MRDFLRTGDLQVPRPSGTINFVRLLKICPLCSRSTRPLAVLSYKQNVASGDYLEWS
jgi:hypothetical protein